MTGNHVFEPVAGIRRLRPVVKKKLRLAVQRAGDSLRIRRNGKDDKEPLKYLHPVLNSQRAHANVFSQRVETEQRADAFGQQQYQLLDQTEKAHLADFAKVFPDQELPSSVRPA